MASSTSSAPSAAPSLPWACMTAASSPLRGSKWQTRKPTSAAFNLSACRSAASRCPDGAARPMRGMVWPVGPPTVTVMSGLSEASTAAASPVTVMATRCENASPFANW